MSSPLLEKEFEVRGGDYANAGGASTTIKDILKSAGLPPDVIRRTAICSYEAEMNIVLYAEMGKLILQLYPDYVRILAEDRGPGIEDIELAMQEGYSTATPEMREMGFGAGMGLPNIKKNADFMQIESKVGEGTRVEVIVKINRREK